MAKRFTDTDKWKKPFIRSLSPDLKLLWFYILDECDFAGVWQVDIEVANIRTGVDINLKTALQKFKDYIVPIDNGEKWFIPDFLEFQYGSQLSKTNNIFKSIDKILSKYDLYQYLNIEITETGTTINSYRNRISKKLKLEILTRDEFQCQYCSEQKQGAELVVDHFLPLNRGGNNDDQNLVCCCVRCNSHKTDILPDIFLQKTHSFLKPTDKIISLLGAYKNLNTPFNYLQGAKDKDKYKDKDKEDEKGVQGEKQSFRTMPQPDDVGDLPDVKIQKAIEALKIQTDQTVDTNTIVSMWDVFKIQNLTGTKYYADVGAVESHFLNWILKKKFERNGIGKTKQERTTDSLTRLAQRGAEALERIRAKSS